jgi:hypothetical protein
LDLLRDLLNAIDPTTAELDRLAEHASIATSARAAEHVRGH